jgi:hypothetical protein
MPDYATPLRSSSQTPSAHTQRSIRHRSGAFISSLSSPNTSSRHIIVGRPPDVPPDPEIGRSNGRPTATASSQSNASHFTAIPARSRRSPSYPAIAILDVSDDTISLPTDKTPTTPIPALSTSYFSRLSTNIHQLAKQISSLAHSALTSLRQKESLSSLPNSRLLSLPITSDSSNGPPPPKGRFGLERGLTPTDKMTHRWPRPRSSRSVAPWLCSTNPVSSRSLRDLRGAGGWSQGHMEDVLQDSRGLGVNWVGQWTLHKWCLLASVTTVFIFGLTCLVFSLLIWFAGKLSIQSARLCGCDSLLYLNSTAYPAAPVILITDSPALVLLTFSASLFLLSSLVGITGTLLNSRPILAVYVLLLFPSFLSFVSVGYLTYKKANFSLDAKVSEAWHRWYSPGARTILQGALGCCGWTSPLHGAVASGVCYTRSPLAGCHGPLVRFEREFLSSAAGTVFSLVPLHLANIFVGLLCANHVTDRFGKGITPARYRLTAHDILSAGSAAVAGKQGVMKQTGLPVPPLSAPRGHSAFREDRQCVATYRHARAKSDYEREA